MKPPSNLLLHVITPIVDVLANHGPVRSLCASACSWCIRSESSLASRSSISTTSTSRGKVNIAAMPVSWFNSAKKDSDYYEEAEWLKMSVRWPDSCMLEKIKTSAFFCRTLSTMSTYFLRSFGSFALAITNKNLNMRRRLYFWSHLKSSSEMRSVPIAPRSAASRTWSGPYHALISSDPSILKNLITNLRKIYGRAFLPTCPA